MGSTPPAAFAPRPDDDDDVRWALSTALVQWNRGGRADAVVWLRRAAEAAETSGAPARAEELRRHAATLAETLWSQPPPPSDDIEIEIDDGTDERRGPLPPPPAAVRAIQERHSPASVPPLAPREPNRQSIAELEPARVHLASAPEIVLEEEALDPSELEEILDYVGEDDLLEELVPEPGASASDADYSDRLSSASVEPLSVESALPEFAADDMEPRRAGSEHRAPAVALPPDEEEDFDDRVTVVPNSGDLGAVASSVEEAFADGGEWDPLVPPADGVPEFGSLPPESEPTELLDGEAALDIDADLREPYDPGSIDLGADWAPIESDRASSMRPSAPAPGSEPSLTTLNAEMLDAADRQVGVSHGDEADASADAAELEVVEADAPDLEVAELEVAEADASDLEVAELEVAEADASDLEVAELEVAEADAPDLEVVELEVAEADASDLDVAELEVAEADASDLEGAELEVAEADASELDVAELEVAEADASDLEGAELEVAEADASDLEGAELEVAEADASDLEGAELEVAEADASELEVAELEVVEIEVPEAAAPEPESTGGTIATEFDPSHAETPAPSAPPSPSSGPRPSLPQDAVADSMPPAVVVEGATVDGIDLTTTRGFEDLPEEVQMQLARSARVESLSAGEEVGLFGAAVVANGEVAVMAAFADESGAVAQQSDVVFTRGTLDDSIALRVVARIDETRVVVWDPKPLADAIDACPWVHDELRLIADRFLARCGATLGPLGERLDDALRGTVFDRMEVRTFAAGENLTVQGESLPGLFVVGGGRVDVLEGDEVGEQMNPGDFLFATAIMGGSKSPATARAGDKGALVLFAPRSVAHELMISVPPLLEVLAG